MKRICYIVFFLLSLLYRPTPAGAQLASFQRLLHIGAADVQLFDGDAHPDGGFVLGGIARDGSISRPVMIKLDCSGGIEWVKALGSTTTIQNVFTRVAITPDSGAVMVANVGQFNSYSIVVIRVDRDGNTVWRKIINDGPGDDGGHDIYTTADGGFVVTGYTNTYGNENVGGSYRDIYLLKLSGAGALEWTKTYGTKNAYDEGTAVIQTSDGGYAVCGRMIDQGTFYAFLLKTDASGQPQFVRSYGDTLHANWAFAVRQLADGGYALAGSTTLLEQNFQSYADNFVLRTNMNGDTLWTQGFFGLPNLFENASSLVVDDQENLLVGVATASYPTVGFVPNKQVAAKFGSNGALQTVKQYNTGGSHYPVIAKGIDDGYLITGFTNNYLGLSFTGIAIKTDADLDAGCFMKDLTLSTVTAPLPMRVRTPAYLSSSGGQIKNYTIETSLTLQDTVLCEEAALPLVADFTPNPGCLGAPIDFNEESSGGATGFSWNFGDPASGPANTANTPSATHTYNTAGTYNVRLTVSNGCQVDSITQPVQVLVLPEVDLGPDTAFCTGQSYTLDAGNPGAVYQWNTGADDQTLVVQDSGLYLVRVTIGGCTGVDSVLINEKNCDFLAFPTAFTPDGDGTNDAWKVLHGPDYRVRVLRIFSRWGGLVFDSELDGTNAWDGRVNGLPAPSDVYIYWVELEYKESVITKKGDITLLR